jgi:glycosyltransferase involved in cell wall biosynthesis
VKRFESDLCIVYARIPRSGRPSVPRNHAISLASGDWLSFLDSDDRWDPERMSTVRPYLTAGNDVVYHALRVEPGPDSWLARLRSRRTWRVGTAMRANDALGHFVHHGNPIATSGLIVRADTLRDVGGFDEQLPCNDDYDAWIRLAMHGAKMCFIDRTLGTYRECSSDRLSRDAIRALHARSRYRARHLAIVPAHYRETLSRRYDYLDAVAALHSDDPALRTLVSRIRMSDSPFRWAAIRLRLVFRSLELMKMR